MDQVTLQVDSTVNAPGALRTRLEEYKASLGDRYDDVVLVVSELVTNSVRHARGNGTADAIEVEVRVESEKVRLEVTDRGPGFSEDAPRGEGLGLVIVDKLADRWGMHDGMHDGRHGFTVWAELSLASAG